MSELIEDVSRGAQEPQTEVLRRMVELGNWMGRREAFGLMAGRCSAADAECLRRMRDDRSYRDLNCSWEEFCTTHLKVSRRSVDRVIGRLEEFGPAYFHLAQLTHLSVGEYRQIAAAVSEAGVEIDGSVVPLLSENSNQLAAAVAELLARTNPPGEVRMLEAGAEDGPEPPVAQPDPTRRIVEACRTVTAIISELQSIESGDAVEVVAAICDMFAAARRSGLFRLPG